MVREPLCLVVPDGWQQEANKNGLNQRTVQTVVENSLEGQGVGRFH